MQILFVFLITIIIPINDSEPKGLKIGDVAPEFSAPDQSGKYVSLKEYHNEGKTIVTFYRGAWCRYCIKQMKDYQDSLEFIQNAGASIIAISPEHPAGIQLTVKKAGVTFPLIHDTDLRIMHDYRVIATEKVEEFRIRSKETGDDITRKYVPVPALYIINQEGIIEFVSFDPDYKQRMTVKEILKRL